MESPDLTVHPIFKTNEGHIPFKSIGRNCQISPFARFYNPENIEIGDNVRIDDFCILSAGEFGIKIGSHIHIACHSTLIGKEQIILEDYSGVGGHSAIYSSSDDFSGNALVGPTIMKEFTNVKSAPVVFSKYSVIGSHCVVLPGVTLGEGCAVGCMSLVKRDLGSYQIFAGIPAKYIKDRETRMTKFTNPPKEHQEHYIESLDWTIKTDEPFYGGKA